MLSPKNLIIALVACFSLQTSLAQETKIHSPESQGMSAERLTRIHQHFQSYIDDNKIAGIQTLVARNGKIVHFESNGFADIESKRKLDDGSIFRIYSMTKPIATVALMMLYEEGMFQLNDPVSDYIPAFKDMKAVVKDDKSRLVEPVKQEIKIVDLLRHTSGLGYGWGPGTYVDSLYRTAGFWGAKDLKGFAEIVGKLPLYHQPGTKWRYGISTDIVGYLVEVLSGQPLDEYLEENIFEPLGMHDTFFQVPADKINRYTSNYRPKEGGGIEVADNYKTSMFTQRTRRFSGGGGLQSTSYDYFLFCQMLLNEGELNGERLLSPKTIELMTMDHCALIPSGPGFGGFPNEAAGFGLGFRVVKDVAHSQNLGSAGSYGWGGAAGTYFVIDPVEKLILIQMIQLRPYAHLNHRAKFHTLVYQAIVD